MLENLEPKEVFHYFEEICGIPHGSYNVDGISDYLVAFAKRHGLFCVQDEWKNVIIIRPASPGREEEPALMLQGHMDMVAVKDPGAKIDPEKEGLRLAVDNERGEVYAEGTSLGADDGIAVAFCLALLADADLSCPRLECVFTTEEEVGMEGATNIDLSVCKAKRMINIDSEEEGYFYVSCAGGMRINAKIPIKREPVPEDGLSFIIRADGFLGGHSGAEIDKGRGNAILELFKALQVLSDSFPLWIAEMDGGEKDNAIPKTAWAKIVLKAEEAELSKACEHLTEGLRMRFKDTDANARISAKRTGLPAQVWNASCTKQILSFFDGTDNGIQSMSADLEGLVQTSLNLGVLCEKEEMLAASWALRSSKSNEKEEMARRLTDRITEYGGTYERTGDYPAWEYAADSPIREKLIRIYRDMFEKDPVVLAIHAGLECGILKDKKPELDCISIGPDLCDVHTTKERLSIPSAERVYRFLRRVIEEKDRGI